jgi:hypothetical protein
MELQILDPFGDHESAGYLRNVYGVKDLELIAHLETAVFQQEVLRTVRLLRRVQTLQYKHLLETHRQFFHSVTRRRRTRAQEVETLGLRGSVCARLAGASDGNHPIHPAPVPEDLCNDGS